MFRFLYIFSVVFFLLGGCASGPKISASVATIGEANIAIKGETFEVVALDFQKANSLEFQGLRAQVIRELTAKGMIPVNGVKLEPRYLVLFDYAVDVAVEEPYERRFVAVTYDSVARSIVHKIRVSSSGSTRSVPEIFPAIVRQAYIAFPQSRGFENVSIER
jgi:hypothetical protein